MKNDGLQDLVPGTESVDSMERMVVNSANAWKPIVPAMSLEQVIQMTEQFTPDPAHTPLTPRAQAATDEVLALLAQRRAQIENEGAATVEQNYPITPVTDPLARDPAQALLRTPR